jgi:ornithine cyclodeaminase
MESAMSVVEEAFRLHHDGKTILPYKTVVDLGERERGRGNAMPGYVGGSYDAMGIKWIAGFPNNPSRHGLPRGTGLFILNDSHTGIPLAVMDCTLLSAMRTGAVTGVAARYLARRDAATVAVIGAGVQARTQLDALLVALPDIERVRAYDVRRTASEAFAAEMSDRCSSLSVEPADTPEQAVRGADIIITVTVADEPIVKEAWVQRGSFFSAVGSYQEEEFEVVTNADRVVVDGLDHVLHRKTPVIALMMEKGLINASDVEELGSIVSGASPGRTGDDERVFFSPIGMAIEDICLCRRVYELAAKKRIGTRLPLFGADV